MAFEGELLALATAFCWTISALSFAAGGKRVGSLPLNLIRLALGLLFLTALMAWQGTAFPVAVSSRTWFWMGLSGFVGFFLGDLCLMRALVLLGPRRTMLFMCLWPVITVVLGWVFIGERLAVLHLLGIAVTLAGIAWVIVEKPGTDDPAMRDAGAGHARNARLGMLLAVLAALGQAVGYIFSGVVRKEIDPLQATQIRAIAGMAGFLVVFLFWNQWSRLGPALRATRPMLIITVGAFFGPCVGVVCSLRAQQHTSSGIAATIAAITPILVIPAVVLIYKERVSLRAVLGAVVAVVGVALLFLAPKPVEEAGPAPLGRQELVGRQVDGSPPQGLHVDGVGQRKGAS